MPECDFKISSGEEYVKYVHKSESVVTEKFYYLYFYPDSQVSCRIRLSQPHYDVLVRDPD